MSKDNPLKRAYTYREFVRLFPLCSTEYQQEMISILENSEKPQYLAGIELPKDLNLVTYGCLDDLSVIAKDKEGDQMIAAIQRITGIELEALYQSNVFDIYGTTRWLTQEIERINKLFSSLAPVYTQQEIAAGVKELSFGSFGILDWYAKRQGIADQNLVRDVAWIRIYTCMSMDNKVAEYQRRLNQEISKQYKHGRV